MKIVIRRKSRNSLLEKDVKRYLSAILLLLVAPLIIGIGVFFADITPNYQIALQNGTLVVSAPNAPTAVSSTSSNITVTFIFINNAVVYASPEQYYFNYSGKTLTYYVYSGGSSNTYSVPATAVFWKLVDNNGDTQYWGQFSYNGATYNISEGQSLYSAISGSTQAKSSPTAAVSVQIIILLIAVAIALAVLFMGIHKLGLLI